MKVVITEHRPLRRALTIVAATVALGLGLLIALDYGQWQSVLRSKVATGQKGALLREVVALRKENEALHFEISRLRRGAEVSRSAQKRNHEELVRLERQIAGLNEELDFYSEVLGGTEADQGPRVKGIQMRPLEGRGRYRYRLVMTHVSKDDRTAEGTVQFDLRGDESGRRKAYDFGEIVESGPESLGFKFKHFHLFQGTLRIPDGFEPHQIRLAVREKARRKNGYEATYDWAALIN